MADLLDTLWQLVLIIIKLVSEVGSLALHWWVVLLWIAWWLCGVNWQKAWPVLARGAWIPVVLIVFIAAFAWSHIMPGERTILGLVMPNLWWHLGAVSGLTCVALFCGWLQGIMRWRPAEVGVDPPAHAEHAHGHIHH